MIVNRDSFAHEKRPPTGVVSPVCGRREDHKTQAICSQLVRQTTRTVKMIAGQTGEDAVPLNKWCAEQWRVFETFSPTMQSAFWAKGNFIGHVAGVGEIRFERWTWSDQVGRWITLVAPDRQTEIRPSDVEAVTNIF